jgi:hypothetical protein
MPILAKTFTQSSIPGGFFPLLSIDRKSEAQWRRGAVRVPTPPRNLVCVISGVRNYELRRPTRDICVAVSCKAPNLNLSHRVIEAKGRSRVSRDQGKDQPAI